jgi:hypothetical protein
MIFAMQELPGEFTTFDFIPGIPAPFNFGLAILMNQKMLTLQEKIQVCVGDVWVMWGDVVMCVGWLVGWRC